MFCGKYLPINRFPSGDPRVSCDPEPGDPIVPGVVLPPGCDMLGIPCPGDHRWVGVGHGNPPYGGGG